jgi:rare lipoprotein A (peptidoglycan hydrolase)
MRYWWTPLLGFPILGVLANPGESLSKQPEKTVQVGVISWYGKGFHGRRTANGERYNMHELTCASRHLPFGTLLSVTNLENGKEIVLRVNDRGPYRYSRILDVSFAAAKKLGFLHSGTVRAEVRRLPPDWEIAQREREEIEDQFGKQLLEDLDQSAEGAVQACRTGKPRKNSACQPFHAQVSLRENIQAGEAVSSH